MGRLTSDLGQRDWPDFGLLERQEAARKKADGRLVKVEACCIECGNSMLWAETTCQVRYRITMLAHVMTQTTRLKCKYCGAVSRHARDEILTDPT
jgi:hypothetical protein